MQISSPLEPLDHSKVAEYEEQNRMGASNLGIVFGPTMVSFCWLKHFIQLGSSRPFGLLGPSTCRVTYGIRVASGLYRRQID